MEEKMNDQELARFSKLERYRELGVNPFGQRYDWKDKVADIRAKYEGWTEEQFQENPVSVNVAGRLMAIRMMGKASFVNLRDNTGNIQGWIGMNVVGEDNYKIFKLADTGDVVGLEGTLMKSKTGELTIRILKFHHVSKCLKPLPEKFHGLTDTEERYRKRYLDMIMNPESRRIAVTRSRIVSAIRRYCDSLGFVEVETPIFSPIVGGAAARPFITHHNTLDKDFYLRIATELNLKKAMIGGIDRVYEIGRIFRNEGMDTRHNPEFTTIELYQAFGDLRSMQDWVVGLFEEICKNVMGTYQIPWGDVTIDFSKPWKSISMAEAILEKIGIDFREDISFERAIELAKEHNVPLEPSWNSTGYIMNAFFEEFVEKDLIQPTFIHTYPIETSPLTKKTDDPRFVDRFEFFLGGFEFGNAYSELNDPFDQLERFEAQLAAKERGDEEANDIDNSFLDAMRYGMPPAGGIGVGIDRVCMLFCNVQNIREVILFPTMKDERDGRPAKKVEKAEEAVEKEVIDFSNVQIEPLFEDQVDFDTFCKSDFRAVKVLACEAVAKSKKLLKFTLDDGSGKERIILSGIHAYYEPEELVGKTCIAITNLPPRPMMGIESCGMLLSAVYTQNGEEKLRLLMVDPHIPAGAKLH